MRQVTQELDFVGTGGNKLDCNVKGRVMFCVARAGLEGVVVC